MSKTKTTLMECNYLVISLQRFKLLGLGILSNVAPKPNEIKEEGIASYVFQERSFFTKPHHLVQ